MSENEVNASNSLTATTLTDEGSKKPLILYKYRWLQLFIYCLAGSLNQMCWISL